MHASLTELNSLLKQAFEGCGLDQGAYESAADLVLWSQVHGFGGFECIEQALLQCAQTPVTQLTFNKDQAEYCEANVDGESLLLCGPILNDWVITKALENDFCVCQLNNVCDGRLLAKLLADARQQELFGLGYWVIDEKMHLIRCDQTYPEYFRIPHVHDVVAENELFIVYAREQNRVIDYLQQHLPDLDAHGVFQSPSQCKQHYQQALSHGLEIPEALWASLIRVSENVLVESTEQSRMGAGA